MESIVTDFLVPRPSFLEGMARVMDMGGSLSRYNRSRTPEEADSRALANDFAMVGQDMRASIEQAHQGCGAR